MKNMPRSTTTDTVRVTSGALNGCRSENPLDTSHRMENENACVELALALNSDALEALLTEGNGAMNRVVKERLEGLDRAVGK